MENLQPFLQEQWWLVLIAFVIVGLIVKMVKTVVKWVITIVVVVVLFGYATQYSPDLVNDAKTMAENTMKDQALKALQEKAGDLTFKKSDDGSYAVSTKGITLKGKPGNADVEIAYMGHSVKVPFETVKKVIEQAQAQSKTMK